MLLGLRGDPVEGSGTKYEPHPGGYQNAADLARFYDQFTAQMRDILKEAGVKLYR